MIKKIITALLITSSLLADDFVRIKVNTNTSARASEGAYKAYLDEVKGYIGSKVKGSEKGSALNELESILASAKLIDIECTFNYCYFSIGIAKSDIDKKISKYY